MLSLVIPVFNEAPNLPELQRRLRIVLEPLGDSYETIFVNDGSRDDTLEVLRGLREQDGNIKILDLSRNWGHQTALTVGMDHARGRAVITMDGDLQHPPEMIPALLAKWREGYDVVQTIRKSSAADGSAVKRAFSRVYYRLFGAISHSQVRPGAADFRLLDAGTLAALNSFRERRRFLRGMIPWMGYRTAYVEYAAEPRFAGRPKYSLLRSAGLGLAGILSFSTFPLRLSFYLGLSLAVLAGLYALYILYANVVRHATIAGWTSLMLVVLVLSSAQFIMQGVMGEYVATIVEEVKQRPLYIVRERIGFDRPEGEVDGSLPGV